MTEQVAPPDQEPSRARSSSPARSSPASPRGTLLSWSPGPWSRANQLGFSHPSWHLQRPTRAQV